MIVSGANSITTENYGGKAYWLSWLIREGYNVPPALFLQAVSEKDTEKIINNLFKDNFFLANLNLFSSKTGGFYDVAIRSSGISEDAKGSSLAGHFKTFVGTVSLNKLKDNIREVIKSLNKKDDQHPEKMGVIIQKMIKPKFSGVVFSSNPINGSKKEIIISVIEGFGEALVSGTKSGEDIIILEEDTTANIPNYSTRIEKKYLQEIYKLSKEIEGKLNFPVDIEWCLDSETNSIFLLQCRPLTGYKFDALGIIPILLENKTKIPSIVLHNDKIKLRLFGEENNIKISKAHLIILDCTEEDILLDLLNVGLDENCKGYSVVLLHPNNISGKIIRAFAKKELEKQRNIFRTCQRYKIRQYCDFTQLESIIHSVADKCFETSWTCIMIIQEIYEPKYTGIVKKIIDGYVIEIGRGHFIPKGIVTTSQYVLNSQKEVTFSNESIQRKSYKIADGQVLEEEINERISIPKSDIELIVSSLYPLLKEQNKAVEFGLLYQSDKTVIPYLIDLVVDKGKSDLNANLILEGVISSGEVTGKVQIIQNDSSKESFHLHYHDTITNNSQESENIVFVCRSPDIGLLSLLEKYDNSRIGFIFKEGSILSHFSIILRERGIPSVVLDKSLSLQEGSIITINAIETGLKPIERIKINI